MSIRNARVYLLPLGAATFAFGALWKAWEAVGSGTITWRVFRGVRVIAERADPTSFYIAVAVLTLFGIMLLALTMVGLLKLRRPPKAMVDLTIERWEKAAPSGLRPLWIGLAIAVSGYVAYLLFHS